MTSSMGKEDRQIEHFWRVEDTGHVPQSGTDFWTLSALLEHIAHGADMDLDAEETPNWIKTASPQRCLP